MAQASPQPTIDVEAIRRDFPILHKPMRKGRPLVYLDNGATAQKPQAVIDALSECYESYYANAHRGIYQLGERITEEFEKARQRVQQFLGAAEAEEIIFTSGTTMGVNLVANAWGRKFLQPGDEILLSVMEHHSNLVPWQQIARERGARLQFLPLTDDGRLDLSRLDEFLTEKTKLVAVTGMSNVLGTINPLAEITTRAKDCGALVLVDGAQSVPHLATNVLDPPIDFLAFSGHKLYGPAGVGVLYGRRELLEAMDPFHCGGGMIGEVYREYSTWAEVPTKFEAGTPPLPQTIGLARAIDYVDGVGFETIQAHEQKLTERADAVLKEIPGLQIYGPSVEERGSIVSFTVEGVHPQDLADLVDRKGVAVRAGHHCTMPLHDLLGVPATTRASFGLYNTETEVDTLAEAIQFARQKLGVAG